MRKLVALLLCLSILLPAAALGDDAFYQLFGTLYDEEVLGEPSFAAKLEEGGNVCILMFDFASSTIRLIGDDEEGTSYGMTWSPVENAKMFALMAVFTDPERFKELDDMDSNGFSIAITLKEGDDPVFINNADDAKSIHDIVMNAIEGE